MLLGVMTTLSVAQGYEESISLKTTASFLRVRTFNGDILCSVAKGTSVAAFERHPDGRVKVRMNAKGCPKEGYVDTRYVRGDVGDVNDFETAVVSTDGLSLRSQPRVNSKSYMCSLSKGAKLQIIGDDTRSDESSWIRIRQMNPRPGCPAEGWVNTNYLRADVDFTKLPQSKGSLMPPSNTEAGVPCEGIGDCERDKPKAPQTNVFQDIVNTLTGQYPPSPFVDELKKMQKNKKCTKGGPYPCNRGLIQMPLVGKGNIGPCGSFHYSPDQPVGVDAYTNPLTACVLTSAMQDWKKNVCKDQAGCTMSWGDISHRTDPGFGGVHVSHTDGQCIDIRPMRKGGFVNGGLTYGSRDYDRDMTKKMIDMFREKGATTVIFNDPKIAANRVSGHDNHVHVCIKDNKKSQETCNNLQVDPAVCPTLQ